MLPFLKGRETAAPDWDAFEAATSRRADLGMRVGLTYREPTYLYGKEPFGQLGRSVDELYAMIDALEKRVRELENQE